jgi:hypothetical protein
METFLPTLILKSWLTGCVHFNEESGNDWQVIE